MVIGGGAALSVVIPNRDGARWLEGCLGSLAAGTRPPDEVIVADAGSGDASEEVAGRHGAGFVPAPAGASRGFAATANRGLSRARGDLVLLLNNDTEVAPDALERLGAAAARHPDAGVVAPLVVSLRDRRTIDSAGLLLYPDGTARPRWHGRERPATDLPHREILMPSGAAAAIRRETLDRVGFLDERLGSYLEDVDWALRAQRRGVTMVLAPEALVFHWFSGTAGALSAEKARLVERNRVIVAARHLPAPMLVASPLWTAARWAVLAAVTRRTGPGGSGVAALRGLAEGICQLPGTLNERRALAAELPVDRREWTRRLRRHRARPRDFLRFGG